jgi:hypothetical protein
VHGGAVTAQDLAAIPLAMRSFANIAYLVPGTEPVEPSDPTKARITAVSFGGSSGLNNVFSVDGGDNSDDYIGGFLQNFSPDAIQEFAVRTSQEDADTGERWAASVVITTKRGSNDWHGDLAFYERAAALNARYPIENPAPCPSSRSRGRTTSARWAGRFEGQAVVLRFVRARHEDASIAYSPASLTQFNALAVAGSARADTGCDSIRVPDNVPVPFRDFLGTMRFDWSQSSRSTWFLRAAIDNYDTDNAFVQQATLPSTGATWHNNYLNLVVGKQYMFSPTMAGLADAGASGLHLTEARNSRPGLRAGISFQFHFADHLRL